MKRHFMILYNILCCFIPSAALCQSHLPCIQSIASKLCFINAEVMQIDENVASCCALLENDIEDCCQSIESRLTALDTHVASCCDDISSLNPELTHCCNHLQSCCDTINSKIEHLNVSNECGATNIRQVDVPYVITQPGHYCCAENLNSDDPIITISSSDVFLDLNGFELLADSIGILIDANSSHSGIVITNGFIVGNDLFDNGLSAGIELSGTNTIRDIDINNVSIRNFAYGIWFRAPAQGIEFNILEIYDTDFGITNSGPGDFPIIDTIAINKTAITNNGANLLLLSSRNIYCHESLFNGAGGFAVSIFAGGTVLIECTEITINNCSFNKCATFGLVFFEVLNLLIENSNFDSNAFGLGIGFGLNVSIKNCTFNNNFLEINNAKFGGGLFSTFMGNATIHHCNFNNNGNIGFVGQLLFDLIIDNCSAESNGHDAGPSSFNGLNGGFVFVNSITNVTLQHCFASSNSTDGFIFDAEIDAEQAFNCILTNCTALSNAQHGFNITGTNICLSECVAKNNGKELISTSSGNGFLLTTSALGIVQQCIAVNNGKCGFEDQATTLGRKSGVRYIGNLAQDNGDNPAPESMVAQFDTNYCTSFTDPGPDISSPFKQVNIFSSSNPSANAPSGYWNNLTLRSAAFTP